MAGITKVFPNSEMHPEFGTALKEAEDAGVKVLYLPCRVTRDAIEAENVEMLMPAVDALQGKIECGSVQF